jgi:putative oxidoreductase
MSLSAIPTERFSARLSGWQPWALAGLRVTLALVFLYHGWPKAIDPAMAIDKFVGFGLPGLLGPIIGWAEVILGVALFVGVYARAAALGLALIIVGALLTVQVPGGISAGLERDVLILIGCLVVACYGPGALALRARRS